MFTRTTVATAVLSALGLASVLHARPAAACSPPMPTDHILVADGAKIPANVRGIPVSLAGASEGRTVKVTSVDSGNDVPAALDAADAGAANAKESYVVPTSALVPGAYQISLPRPEGSFASASFTVVPAAPAPAPAVSVTVGNPRRATVAVSGAADCTDDYDASVLDVTVRVAEDYRPYKDLVAFDGTKSSPNTFLWTLSEGDAFPPPAKGIPETLSKTYVFARRCEEGPGKGSVTFAARVRGLAGAEASASADLDFVACDSLEKKPVIADDGGTRTSTATPQAAAADADDGDGGCSVARDDSGAAGFAALGTLCAFVALTRRRRRVR